MEYNIKHGIYTVYIREVLLVISIMILYITHCHKEVLVLRKHSKTSRFPVSMVAYCSGEYFMNVFLTDQPHSY